MSLLRRLSKFTILSLQTFTHHIVPSTDALIYPQKSTIFSGNDSVQVDLGYAIYEGVANASTGLHTFKGWIYNL